jgi:PD-(D/E)XK nuclease superfamily
VNFALNDQAGATLLEDVIRHQEARTIRKDGVHVTDVVMCRRRAWYRLHDYPAAAHPAAVNLQMLLGTALGALLEELHHSEVPVTLETPAATIHGTVDILELGPEGEPVRVVELKESRSSSKKPLAALGYYTEQVGAYCAAVGVPSGRLHICHLLGDYTGPKRPILNTWDLTFSARELAAWEAELALRTAQVVGERPPPADYTHYSFECEGCAYRAHCDGGDGYTTGFFEAAEEGMQLVWQ